MWEYNHTDELYHHGIKGMKWGIRRARRQNAKVDKSFKKWKENSNKKANAIDLGKKANIARMDYERDRSNKELKKTYKQANRDYKKALNSNTTYRKGAIRGEVGKDASRKYLSEAKKVQKQLNSDPNNKALKKQYNYLQGQHDVQRAKARKAPEVGAKRSARKAAAKRAMTMSVKAAATAAAIGVGTKVVNDVMMSNNVTFNGQRVKFSAQNVNSAINAINKGKEFMGFFY